MKLIYLDNAATTQKPKQVIERISKYYKKENANVHRGLYKLSINATKLYENTRMNAARFVNTDHVVFTSNATEAFNLLAYTIGKNAAVVTTIMEHHSNFVPWQQLSKIKIVGMKNYEMDEEDLFKKLTDNTKILTITYVSNVLGKNNLEKILPKVRKKYPEILIIVDATQAVAHIKVDSKKLCADAIIYSGHKMYGPTGIGVLAVNERLAKQLTPFNYGGSMIKTVTKNKTEFAEFPQNLEAGTPNIAGVIGLNEAINYVKKIKKNNLINYAIKQLKTINGLTIIGTNQISLASFVIEGVHPHDIASLLDEKNICVRAGHHCCMPLMQELGINSTTRISLSNLSTKKEIDTLIKELKFIVRKFR